MFRGAQVQHDFYTKQAVEVRKTHNGMERWRPARIHRRTSRGYEVIYKEGPQAPQHILFADLRPMEETKREHTPRIGTPALTPADIDRINAQAEAEAQRKSAEAVANTPPPQTLVLVKRQPEAPASAQQTDQRRKRMPKHHEPTPLSEALRRARINRGAQQRTIAELTEISRLSHIELGDVEPTDAELASLALALDLNLDHLVTLRDGPAPARAAPALPAVCQPEPEPEPEPERPTIAELVREAPKPVRAPESGELETLREENAILRRALLFYAGRE